LIEIVGFYTERVLEAIRLLRDCVMPNFAQKVDSATEAVGDGKSIDQNEFIDATRLVYDGVKMTRNKYQSITFFSTFSHSLCE
jgi:catenin alpha